MEVMHLEEVSPLTAPTDADRIYFRDCDFCGKSVLDDMIWHKPDRTFYRMEPDGLNVCEWCLPIVD